MKLDLSVINLTADIIKLFNKAEVITYDELVESLIVTRGEYSKHVIFYAINLLFLLGKVEYSKSTDSLYLQK